MAGTARARSRRALRLPVRRRRPASARLLLLIGTRKGAWILESDRARSRWRQAGPHLLGNQVYHFVLDPRDGRTMLIAAKTGHLGPTVFRSNDLGRTWTEAAKPPAFPNAGGDAAGKSVGAVFWLSPGHATEPGVWYAGTDPHGLFRSEDSGANWAEVRGFSRMLEALPESGIYLGTTPGGALTHSVLVDPRDARHLYASLSTGGTFESLDAGAAWKPINDGVAADYLPEIPHGYGHDPHSVVFAAGRPDRLYQQNHCGSYRLDRPGVTWERIGLKMPASIGDIGFGIVAHPRDPDSAWVFPMDGTSVWPRTSPAGKPAVYRTRNAGRSWQRQDAGLPRSQAWFTVMRQAFACDALEPAGLYFGTSSGEIWASSSEGARWKPVASHLPYILSVATAVVPR